MKIELNCYGIIYKITNKVNKKTYIGQTTKGFKNRYNADSEGIERVYNFNIKSKTNKRYFNSKLAKDIEKYGFDSFEVIEVFDVAYSKNELNDKEMKWIKEFDCYKSGYNQTLGGEESFINTFKRKCIKLGDNNICYIDNYITSSLLKDRNLNQVKILIGTINRAFLECSKNENVFEIIIPIDFYRKNCIKSSNTIEDYKTNIESLKKDIYISSENKKISIIDDVEIYNENNEFKVKITLNKENVKYINIEENSNYTELKLNEMKKLSGKYELGLYIAYNQFKNIGKRYFSIDGCIKYFNFEGTKNKELIRNIKKALEQIKIKLGYEIKLETEIYNRQITNINFIF